MPRALKVCLWVTNFQHKENENSTHIDDVQRSSVTKTPRVDRLVRGAVRPRLQSTGNRGQPKKIFNMVPPKSTKNPATIALPKKMDISIFLRVRDQRFQMKRWIYRKMTMFMTRNA